MASFEPPSPIPSEPAKQRHLPPNSSSDYGSDLDSSGLLSALFASSTTSSLGKRSSFYGSDIDVDIDSLLLGGAGNPQQQTLQELGGPRAQGCTEPHTAIVRPPPSDYGSEFDTDGEEALRGLLAELEGQRGGNDGVSQPAYSLPPRSSQSESDVYVSALEELGPEGEARIRIEYDLAPAAKGGVARDASGDGGDMNAQDNGKIAVTESKLQPAAADTRSPLERFRTPPKKPLSVTDIVSPAWCELQYAFSLSRHGRKRRTPAMKQGTKVHQELEAQVHEVVPVEVRTREDGWGLRIWNVIQGLRTLRATGLTRELEVWGVIDGEVVNGVIDELSYTCPDPELEAALEESAATARVSQNQMSITDFFAASSANSGNGAWLIPPHHEQDHEAPPVRKVYITDIKTRTTPTLPSQAAMRSTTLQLMLYHHLLQSLAADRVPRATLFARYQLDPHAAFSQSLVDDIAALDFNFRPDDSPPPLPTASSAAAAEAEAIAPPFSTPRTAHTELSTHRTLWTLWTLLQRELRKTLPSRSALSPILHAEFRSQQDHARVLGSRTFALDDSFLEDYVTDTMRWWRGERAPRGVAPQEAFKCGSCEFADECVWRWERAEGRVRRGMGMESGKGSG